MNDIYSKRIYARSRLHLDLAWSEDALARIERNAWRVVLPPVRNHRGTFLYHDGSQLNCDFKFSKQTNLWSLWGSDNQRVYEFHINTLPLLLRDLSDSSIEIKTSPAHETLWREQASNLLIRVSSANDFNLPINVVSIICKSMQRILDSEIPVETIIHGDLHPGNILSNKAASIFQSQVCDLENLTVGTVFVDALYCATWAQFLDDSCAYWNLISYLEQKSRRRLNEIDFGLSAILMLGQATANSERIRNRILNGLIWLTNTLTSSSNNKRLHL